MNHATVLGILLFLAPFCWAEPPGQQNPSDDGVRAKYDGSADLPDGIAYAAFLNLLGTAHGNPRADDHALHIIVEAIGAPSAEDLKTPGWLERLEGRIDYFRNDLRNMRLEQYEAKIRILCSDPSSKSDEELYDAMNAADDVSDAIRDKHLIIAKQFLTAPERKVFERFLNQRKLSIGYVKVDNRKLTFGPENSVFADVARGCESYQQSYNDLL